MLLFPVCCILLSFSLPANFIIRWCGTNSACGGILHCFDNDSDMKNARNIGSELEGLVIFTWMPLAIILSRGLALTKSSTMYVSFLGIVVHHLCPNGMQLPRTAWNVERLCSSD